MNDFMFNLNTNYIFGRNGEEQVGEQVARYSKSKKALIVYATDRVKESGLFGKVADSLEKSGIAYYELGGVVPNPRVSLVRKGIEIAKKDGIDFILGVGGGSVIDTARAIAGGFYYDGDVWDLCTGEAEIPEKVLGLGAVLTLAAAGSESSMWAVISDDETGQKCGMGGENLRPLFSVLNPELTYTVNKWQTACGACDMMAHSLEPYFTISEETSLNDGLMESLFRSIIAAAPRALENPDDYDARATLMWASTLSMSGIFGVGRDGDMVPHGVGEEMGGRFDLTHGATLSAVLPSWMEYHYKNNLPRYVQYAHNVWGVPLDVCHPEEVALEGIRRTREFFKSMGLPVTLGELGADVSKIDEMAESIETDWDDVPGLFFSLDTQGLKDLMNMAK